jgi:hypothetical protein
MAAARSISICAAPAILTCYQQPDADTLLAVMSEPKKMRDAALASG